MNAVMEKVKTIEEVVIQELTEYKLNKATYELMQNDSGISISAQVIPEVPRSVTNKFTSATENQAFNRKDSDELERDIKRVDIWLTYLEDEEEFAIRNFYIHNKSYNTISFRWHRQGGLIYSSIFWKRKRKEALHKIIDLCKRA